MAFSVDQTDAVQVFEKAVADNVEKADMVGVYKRDPLLALEAVTLLSKEELSQNIPAHRLLDMLRNVKDEGTKELPSWFLPKDQVTYNQRHFANGSFSTVHKGTWSGGSDVIIKCLVMKGDAELDAALRKVFIEEAKLWHELNHPHVLKLYGACHEATPPFFVCEVSTEGDLSEFLKTDRGKSNMWRLLYETALGIEYLHGKSFVHGDLKLNNILVGKDGHARVADFGMSRYKLRSRNLMLTALDPVIGGSGALRWCAPEALEAKAQIESDVYSFAMCLIEAVSGKVPYYEVGDDDDEVRRRIIDGILPEQLGNMDYPTQELVKRMTVFDRSKRPKIREIIAELNKRKEAEFNNKVDGAACTESKGGKKPALRSELNGTVCPKCSNKLKNGSPVCQMCKSSASTQVVTDSKELHRACLEGDVTRVRALLKEGNADVNSHDVERDGWTPLYKASLEGHIQIVKALLEANADPNVATQNGETPLHAASVKHYSEIARALLEGGANVHSKNKENHEPIHACIKSVVYSELTKETLKTLQVLMWHGATLAGKLERWAREEAPPLRLCIFLWVDELADGVEFSDIPVEVIKQGADRTQSFIAKIRSSRVIVHHKI